MFWAINIILTNCWKIYEKLYGPFLSSTGHKRSRAYRQFLEALVELLFCCDSEIYAENVSEYDFKDYPKYSYETHISGRKPQYSKKSSINLSTQSLVIPFIFKGNPGRPSISIPAKITPISRHHHIKPITNGHCLICRNSNKVQKAQIARIESIAYGTVFRLFEDTLKEVKPSSKIPSKESKQIRGTETKWKCSECQVPICRAQRSCWKIAHRRLFSR
jgi:hypothetical protein